MQRLEERLERGGSGCGRGERVKEGGDLGGKDVGDGGSGEFGEGEGSQLGGGEGFRLFALALGQLGGGSDQRLGGSSSDRLPSVVVCSSLILLVLVLVHRLGVVDTRVKRLTVVADHVVLAVKSASLVLVLIASLVVLGGSKLLCSCSSAHELVLALVTV